MMLFPMFPDDALVMISGTLKMIQAVLLAAMIALGYSLAILLAGGIGL